MKKKHLVPEVLPCKRWRGTLDRRNILIKTTKRYGIPFYMAWLKCSFASAWDIPFPNVTSAAGQEPCPRQKSCNFILFIFNLLWKWTPLGTIIIRKCVNLIWTPQQAVSKFQPLTVPGVVFTCETHIQLIDVHFLLPFWLKNNSKQWKSMNVTQFGREVTE